MKLNRKQRFQTGNTLLVTLLTMAVVGVFVDL